MRITITGKGMEVSDYLKEVAEKKVNKLSRYFKPDAEAHVTMSIERSRHIVEVTIPFDSGVLRGEEATGDMYASIDGVLKKLEKQILKHRTKLEKRLRQDAFKNEAPIYEENTVEEAALKVVRTKRYTAKPMDLNEAVLQMELLGHEFFVFTNSKTNEVNVLYKRKDGNVGLLEPEIL
jgi:putative sigma-54 modulation protein